MSEPILGFIHKFVPATADGNAPFLLLLHGTGGNEDDLLRLGQTLLPGAAMLSPRGKILENGMPRFFRRLAEGVFDLDDLQMRTHELADFVESAATVYGLEGRKGIAVGFSNGANIAASLLLLRPEVLSAAVLLRPMLPLEPDLPADLRGIPVFIASGRSDSIVPQENVEQLAALLTEFGADVKHRWQDTGHGLIQDDIVAAENWLAHVP